MKHLITVAFMALGLFSLTANVVTAHHNSSHSQGPCGPNNPCKPTGGK